MKSPPNELRALHHVLSQDENDTRIAFCTVDSKFDKQPKQYHSTWGEFCSSLSHVERKEKDGHGVIFSEFDGGGRSKANVLSVTAIVLDIEQQGQGRCPPAVEEVADFLKASGYAAAIYTTFSHKHTNPRYRLIFPIDRPISPTSLEKATRAVTGGLNLDFCTDSASWSLARLMYLPACPPNAERFVAMSPGVPLSAEALEALPSEQEDEKPSSSASPSPSPKPGTQYGLAALNDACAKIEHAPKGTRNPTLNTEAFNIGQLVAGGEIDSYHAKNALAQSALSAGLEPAEIRGTLNSGFEAGILRPRKAMALPVIDFSRLYSPAQVNSATTPFKSTIDVKHLDEIELNPSTKWLIKGWLPSSIVGAVIAPSHTGKSLLVLDWCAHVALGRGWQGNRTNQGTVVYLSGEGGRSGLGKRRQAWEIQHSTSLAGSPFYFIECLPNLLDANDTYRVLEALTPIHASAPIKLIVVDTKSVHMQGGDESSNDDGATFCRNLMTLSKKFEACVLYVAHTGHGASDRERGASSTYGAVDLCFLLKKKGDYIEISSTKARDWNKPTPINAKVSTVPLGYLDEDGDAETSAVLEYFGPSSGKPPKESKYVAILRSIIARVGRDKEAVRKIFYEQPLWTPTTAQDTKKKAFSRAWEEIENGLVVDLSALLAANPFEQPGH